VGAMISISCEYQISGKDGEFFNTPKGSMSRREKKSRLMDV
jgi:hypothetical protein